MNYSDSERVATKLEELGCTETTIQKEADIIIFNTCSIRQKAEDKVYGQMIGVSKMRKYKPDMIVAFTGCMVRTSSHKESEEKDKLINTVAELDLVFRINELPKLPDLLAEMRPHWFKEAVENDDEYKDYFSVRPKYANKHQAFVPIMSGCDKFCTYCIVPFTRGREWSRPMDEILKECKQLVENGCKEITLIGQNVNSYGLSPIDYQSGQFSLKERQKMGLRTQLENPPFVQLLRSVDALKEKGLRRLRYTSSHPYDMSYDLIDAHTELATLCEHIHLPIQSGNNEVLQAMNRHYTVEHYQKLMDRIKEKIPHIGLTTDIIVGFSGETEEQFEDSYRLIEQIRWNMIYFAKYSVRKGTMGARIADDVPDAEKSRRWRKINELLKICSEEMNEKFRDRIVNVLVEKCENGICSGKSREFIEAQFPGTPELIGEEVDVLVTEPTTWTLNGDMVAIKSSIGYRDRENSQAKAHSVTL